MAQQQIPSDTSAEQAQVLQQIDRFSEAFRSKDVDLMMTLFADDIVSFDIIPPLQYVGSDKYKKSLGGNIRIVQGSDGDRDQGFED